MSAPYPSVLKATSSKNTNLARVQDRIIITKFSDTVSFDREKKIRVFDHFQVSTTYMPPKAKLC